MRLLAPLYTRSIDMKAIQLCLLGFALLGSSLAQRSNLPPAITQKPGAWNTLKLVNTAPTPNDARNFGSAFPIGNGRFGAKVFGWPAPRASSMRKWGGGR